MLCAPAAPPPGGTPATAAAEADAPPPKPPLLFLHGGFHGAWCWAEHFLPFFAAAGYDSYALSLRGHGGSELGEQHPPGCTGTLASHLDDLASFIASLGRPPVLLAHSLGGLFAATYAGEAAAGRRPPLAGLALLAATPPSGTAAIIRRQLWRHPLQVLRIGWCVCCWAAEPKHLQMGMYTHTRYVPCSQQLCSNVTLGPAALPQACCSICYNRLPTGPAPPLQDHGPPVLPHQHSRLPPHLFLSGKHPAPEASR